VQAQACGTLPVPFVTGAGGGGFVDVGDNAGNTFLSPPSTATCVQIPGIPDGVSDAINTVLTDAGISSVALSDILPDGSTVISDAQTVGSAVVNANTNCPYGSNSDICSLIAGLQNAAKASGQNNYFGETWSAEIGSGCQFSLTGGPAVAETSLPFGGDAQLALSIVQAQVSGVATPSSGNQSSCPSGELPPQPWAVTLTAPNVVAGSESLIQGQVLDANGNPVSGESFLLTATAGTLSSSGATPGACGTVSVGTCVTTSGDGLFSVVFTPPTSVPQTITIAVAAVASVTYTVTINQLAVVNSVGATTSTLESDQASLSVPSTGITVTVTDNTDPAGTTVNLSSLDYSQAPQTGADVSLSGTSYYDVQITGIESGTANVCISPDNGASSMKYYLATDGWDNNYATDVQTSGNTICGNIPVSDLSGTPVAIGSPVTTTSTTISTTTSIMGVSQFPAGFLQLVAVMAVVLIGLAALQRKSRSDIASNRKNASL